MGIFDLFGKKKISEKAAARLFVQMAVEYSQEYWPKFAAEWCQIFPEQEQALFNPEAQFEFSIAVISMQLQALPNLFPADQAERLLQYVFEGFLMVNDGPYICESIKEYLKASQHPQAPEKLEYPGTEIASFLFDRLGFHRMNDFMFSGIKSPLILTALTEKLVRCGPVWKILVQKHKIIQD